MTSLFNKDKIQYFLFTLSIIVFRYYWSLISQWREDQSTNLWIAYTSEINQIPVGLLSSKDIATPNFIILIGKILNIFDNILLITITISLLQIFFFYLLVKQLPIEKDRKYFLIIILSFSTLLSASSIEFWNNWILISLNSLFFYFYIKYLNSRKILLIPILFVVATLPFAVYLAGLVNTITFCLLIIFEIFRTKDFVRSRFLYQKCIFIVASISLYIYYVWIPFLNNVSINQLTSFSEQSIYDRVNLLSDEILHLPGTFLTIWTTQKTFYIFQINRDIVSNFTFEIFKIFVEFHKILIVLFLYCLLQNIKNKSSLNKNKTNYFYIQIVFTFFIFFTTLITPVLGGPNYRYYERLENYVQFYPFFIIILYFTFTTFTSQKQNKRYSIFINLILITFVSLNIFMSVLTINENLKYSGDKLTEADVPLIQKIEIVDFIAEDMKSKGLSKASISYDLGGGIWDWIPSHGSKFSTWYPNNPYTIGRIYDYLLLKKYSISNLYEGENSRNFKDSEYIISYKFQELNTQEGLNYKNYEFKRLRLSIRD